MHPSSKTPFRLVPIGPSIRWLLAALLLPFAACQGVETPDGHEGTATELGSYRADGVSADDVSVDVVADVVATDGVSAVAGSAIAGSDIIGDPAVQAYLAQSPAYRRYRAYVERKEKAAQAAESSDSASSESDLSESDLSESDLSESDLSESDLSESDLSESDLSDATIASLILPPGTDDLVTYANRCDAATGIHVPAFNCNNGTDVPQGVVQTTLTDLSIGMTGGSRVANVSLNTITAAGTDIWNNADSFFFAYTNNLSGGNPDGSPGGVDGYAEVLVTGLQNTHAFAKAGVMFRANTTAGAVNVMLAITPTSGAMLQKRTTPNGTSTNEILTGRAVPTWLRLLRRTNTFTGFVSTDRVTWTQVGNPVTLNNFTANPLVGLAVTSHSPGVSTQAVLDKFSWTPLAAFASCDQPNALHGRCDPGSRFQVLVQTPEASVVANCRKGTVAATATANQYADIAVIQYNKQNGAICFYQAYGVANGNSMPAPSTGSGPWLTPELTHAGGCTGCHDNGAFIKSRYLTQLNEPTFPSKPNLIPSYEEGYDNSFVPLEYVGRDFVPDRSWSINTAKDPSDTGINNCNSCHRLSVNNVVSGAGTAAHLAPLATALSFAVSSFNFKSPHGPTSPIWMRPGQIVYNSGAEATALRFSDCAIGYWGSNTTPGWTTGTPTAGCTFAELGNPWDPPADSQDFTDVNIGITGGTRTPNGMAQQLKAAGSDIFGTSDQFLYSYKLLAGDGAATVKVNSLTNTHAFAKGGIMFRDGTGPSAVNAMVEMTPTSGAQFQYRSAVGGATTSLTLAGQTFPRWLKISRAGRTFVGYVSSDQGQWTQVGTPVTLPDANFPPNSLALVGLAATSHNPSTQTTANFDHFAWLPASSETLLDANIGITNGSHTFRAGKHTILAGGTDIYNTADQFFYAFKSKGGIASITAKVTGIANTDPFAKAGVMFRNSALNNSANVMMEITATQGASFQYRPVLGANTTSINVPGYSAPRSVRLDRAAGGVFRGYVQENNGTWTQIGTVTLPSFNDPALVGLAVTSHNANAVTTATFTEVTLP